MNRKGLGRYGVVSKQVVRAPATGHDNSGTKMKICPECGHPVGATKGPQRIASISVVVDPETMKRLADDDGLGDGELVTHGWKCKEHSYPVILPQTTDSDAVGFVDGWTGVEIEFADGRTDYVPVPEKEVEG
jgi:hypothetical protein